MSDTKLSRRTMVAAAAAAFITAGIEGETAEAAPDTPKIKGRIKQSVSRWCFGGISLDDLCVKAKEMGMVGIDLLSEGEFDTVKKHGLICTMSNGIGGISDCWNRVENHDKLVKDAEHIIPILAKYGFPNVITFSGNRKGISDKEGMENCAKGLKRIMKLAEDNNVNVVMELLNSKHDHGDYQCDHTAWGVDLCKMVGSDHMKLLYDIYHMQIMEGDMCRTIQDYSKFIGHIHTGGVPGRNEIDETQEIYYPRVMKALLDAKYTGFVAHEFIPKRDPLKSLAQGFKICDI